MPGYIAMHRNPTIQATKRWARRLSFITMFGSAVIATRMLISYRGEWYDTVRGYPFAWYWWRDVGTIDEAFGGYRWWALAADIVLWLVGIGFVGYVTSRMVQWLSSRQQQMAPPLRSAMRWALLQQAVILFLASTLLDGGMVLQMCFHAFVAFWAGVIVICYRRHTLPTKLDLIFVRSGFLVLCIISFLLTPAVWRLQGF